MPFQVLLAQVFYSRDDGNQTNNDSDYNQYVCKFHLVILHMRVIVRTFIPRL